jgi:hypothetical protein
MNGSTKRQNNHYFFTAVIISFLQQASAFITVSQFHPSLTFEGKSLVYPESGVVSQNFLKSFFS